MKDLIDKLGSTPASTDGAKNTQTTKQVEPVAKVEEPTTTAIDSGASGDTGAVKDETSGTVKDPNDWSKESALKEVIKLREEQKLQRLKYSEKLDQFKEDLSASQAPLKEELEELKKYKDELTKIKAAEEDKKRTLEDKVSHRESRISELEAKISSVVAERDTESQQYKEQLSVYQAQEEARKQLYMDKLKAELEAIPEKFREQAELISKGAGDPSEALVAISEARIKGFFEDKTVIVNHAVPGASDGARATKDQLEGAARAGRDKMSATDKVKAALKEIRQGESNSAFRSH